MRLILSFTMILTTSLVAGCGDDVTTGGAGGGGGKGTTSSTTSGAASTSSSGQGGSTASSTTASSTTSSTGGDTGKTCGDCVEASDPFKAGTSCGDAIGACKQDGPCGAWLDCTDECIKNDYVTACFSACDAASAGSKSLYDPIYACVCSVCSDPCGLVCK